MTMKRTAMTAAVTALVAAVALTGCSKPAENTSKTPATAEKANFIPRAGKPVNKYDKFFEEKDGVKHFYIWIEEKEHEILKGVKVPIWSFNGTLPGPEIRVQEGDKVQVHFRNTGSQPHSIHFHGQLGLTQQMDGVPATSATVNPDKEFTYEFDATSTGTLMYHCHVSTYNHVDMGMYGAMIVEPKNEKKTWDKEYSFILDDWQVGGDFDPFGKDPHRDFNYFTINGKSFPETTPVEGKVGEKVKLRFLNMGYETYSIHSHGYGAMITHLDGFPVPAPYQRDIITVAPGERVDVEITIREGIYPWHDHNLHHTLNNGEYLGGATFLVIGTK